MARPDVPAMQGRLAYQFKNYPEAVRLWEDAATRDPSLALDLGRAYYRLGNREKALTAWQQAAQVKGVAEAARQELALDAQYGEAFEALMADYRLKVASGDEDGWSDLRERFEQQATSFGASPYARRSGMIVAECLIREGRKPEAADRCRELRETFPDLTEWSLWREGLLRAESDPQAAKALLDTMNARFPQSPLLPSARLALAKLDSGRAEELWKAVSADSPDSTEAEEALYLLATKGSADPLTWLRRYREVKPSGRYLKDVARALSEYELSAKERYDVALDLMDRGDYKLALRLLDDLDTPWANYRKGVSHWQLRNYTEAVQLLHKAATNGELRGRSLVVLGRLEDQRKRYDEAAKYFKQASALSDEWGLQGLNRLALVYRKQDLDAQAVPYEQALVKRFPNSSEAIEVRWRFMQKAYAAGNLNESKRWATELGYRSLQTVNGPGGAFWLGKILEREGKTGEAIAVYRKASKNRPNSYYSWRAQHRLDALEGRASDPGFIVRPVALTAPQDDLRPLVDGGEIDPANPAARYLTQMADWPANVREWVYLGLSEPALRYAQKVKADADLRAWLHLQTGNYRQTIAVSTGKDPRLVFPLGYRPLVERAAELNGLDPLLLTSLVKQESLFDPTSRSWVGAMGLAQLMPYTADWVRKQVPGPERELTDPFWNLKLGAWYLQYTHREFGGTSPFAVAAYNAGPGAVRKWQGNGGGDMDAWVEAIPFSETRHYVKKVFGNLWSYQAIYGKP
ncbi:Soluble lytic murein transglycosylase precursor [compost metagenome]